MKQKKTKCMKKNEKYGEGMSGFSSKLFKLVLTLLLVVCATGVKAFSIVTRFTIGGVTYTQNNTGGSTVSVTGYDLSESTALVIPDKVTNETTEYTVTSIGASAFINCRKLTSVTIPSSVTSIGTDAFYNCSKLATVTEGDLTYTITDTKATVTGWVNSPKVLTVPSKILGGAYSVTGIGDRAFESPQPCNSLTSVTISEEVTSIEDALADKKPATIGSDKVYNLDGSLEMNPTTGTVYIVNGKKVIYI